MSIAQYTAIPVFSTFHLATSSELKWPQVTLCICRVCSGGIRNWLLQRANQNMNHDRLYSISQQRHTSTAAPYGSAAIHSLMLTSCSCFKTPPPSVHTLPLSLLLGTYLSDRPLGKRLVCWMPAGPKKFMASPSVRMPTAMTRGQRTLGGSSRLPLMAMRPAATYQRASFSVLIVKVHVPSACTLYVWFLVRFEGR